MKLKLDPETKTRSFQWKTKLSTKPKKGFTQKSLFKCYGIVNRFFFNFEEIVHSEFVP